MTPPKNGPLVEFTPVDELGWYFDRPGEPNNIHFEALIRGHLDPVRLRAAVSDALAAHPLARARRVPSRGWDRRVHWEIAAGPDVPPVGTAYWHTRSQLATHRQRALATAPALDLAPPLRICHAAGPADDVLILNAHHAALDGLSCLRLLRSIARRYAGRPDPVPADPLASRIVATLPARDDGGHGAWPPSTRIAPDRANPLPGYGYHLVTLPCRPRIGQDNGKPAATVNDVLLTALMLTVAEWNTGHHRRTGTLRVTVPLDARAPTADGVPLGNLSRLAAVASDQYDRADPARLLAGIARQMTLAKRGGPQIDSFSAALVSPWLPVAVKARLVNVARRTAARLFSDTTLLSNLGSVTDPPDFGAPSANPQPVSALWFSGPAPMPRGLAVGAVTLRDGLHLCFRYRLALFDEPAAARFAELFSDSLAALQDPRLPAGTAP